MTALKRLLRRLVDRFGVVPFVVLFACYTNTVPDQDRLAVYVAVALKQCKADGKRCAAAKQCKASALEAVEALQDDRAAQANLQSNPEASVKALALPVAAEAQCKALGFKAEVR